MQTFYVLDISLIAAGQVAELADATASKAVGLTLVRVRVPLCPDYKESYKVFTYRNKPIKDIRTAFKKALSIAGVKNLTFHSLRHTFATRLVLAGTNIITVSKLLGHSSIAMTARYSHASADSLNDAVNTLD